MISEEDKRTFYRFFVPIMAENLAWVDSIFHWVESRESILKEEVERLKERLENSWKHGDSDFTLLLLQGKKIQELEQKNRELEEKLTFYEKNTSIH